ncbi:16S rRNA (uracil(1498)-N(3))-methyltransferase [Leucobacter sp. W1153]|uniref:16S rRNA (uracil(1498)-N(3))-methyltransferase n=1 Tax=unclassified Leucobacter TaxID=2621730 RepID=UPI003F3C3FEF
MAHLYYREDLAAADLTVGNVVEVLGDEARHAVRVSRLRVGERIIVGDGAGTAGHGEVTVVDRDRFAVRFDSVYRDQPTKSRLVLVQALAKGDRDERAVEQATEFGVDRIMPWQAERSVSRWDGEKTPRGVAKWQRVAREAAKQSLRVRIPQVDPLVTLSGLCELAGTAGTHLLVLHPRGVERLSAWARQLGDAEGDACREIIVIVGPEGGLSDREIDALERAGAQVVQLGDAVLRTSSAGPAALALLNAALGRW